MKNKGAGAVPKLTDEDRGKALDFDLTVMNNVPYYFQLQVMPLNFPEFWPLINSIDRYKSSESYEKTKWRLAFQKYNENLPGYYNDYLNSFLRHLNATELSLKWTKQVYLDNNIPLQHAVNRALAYQDQVEKGHEAAFKNYLHEHAQGKNQETCCQNVRRMKTPLNVGQGTRGKESLIIQKKLMMESQEVVDIAPISDRESLIGHTLWMFSKVQLSLETFQPVVIGQGFTSTKTPSPGQLPGLFSHKGAM